jgi:ATP-dependent DNA helicase RecQ
VSLTATATTRVREDILRQLRLRDPAVFVASFNRPNLTYRVQAKSKGYQQILEFLKSRPRESGIIYCFSRAGAEGLAEKLRGDGIRALPYHAGLSQQERAANQESFLRDETRIVCATIAFGMGINKPNVRFVIHHDLPKNIEGYYQETGRAGRDGLPGECLLLFSAGDVAKQTAFIAEKTDPEEQRLAREQLTRMAHYAEDGGCRRVALLGYFGEDYPRNGCGGCDNCLNPRDTWDGTIAAQKFLSCVFRIRQKSGFNTGLNHVVAVLLGSDAEKVRQWGHDSLSTFGIGTELGRNEWGSVGRELVRLGYLRQTSEPFTVVELSPEGLAALKDRRQVFLTRPMERPRPRAQKVGDIECDELLFEKLRQLRKTLADEHGVPPYIVFGDVSLRQMAREYPVTESEFRRISGVGERKMRDYGESFLDEIRAHLRLNDRQVQRGDLVEQHVGPVNVAPELRVHLLAGRREVGALPADAEGARTDPAAGPPPPSFGRVPGEDQSAEAGRTAEQTEAIKKEVDQIDVSVEELSEAQSEAQQELRVILKELKTMRAELAALRPR